MGGVFEAVVHWSPLDSRLCHYVQFAPRLLFRDINTTIFSYRDNCVIGQTTCSYSLDLALAFPSGAKVFFGMRFIIWL